MGLRSVTTSALVLVALVGSVGAVTEPVPEPAPIIEPLALDMPTVTPEPEPEPVVEAPEPEPSAEPTALPDPVVTPEPEPVVVTPEPEPEPEPVLPAGMDEGTLICGEGAKPAIDYHPEWGWWAYCEPALID